MVKLGAASYFYSGKYSLFVPGVNHGRLFCLTKNQLNKARVYSTIQEFLKEASHLILYRFGITLVIIICMIPQTT